MSGFVKAVVVMMLALVPAFGADPAVVVSTRANQDAPLQLDSSSPFWKGSHVVYMAKIPSARPSVVTERRSAHVGRRIISTSSSRARMSNYISSPTPTPAKKQTSFGIGTSPRHSSGQTSPIFSVHKEFEVSPHLNPGQTYKLTLDLWATSNVFRKEHRLRLEISSSNFPRFDRNLNTGDDGASGRTFVSAANTILMTQSTGQC